MIADAPAPYVAKLSATMILTIHDKEILVSHNKEGFYLIEAEWRIFTSVNLPSLVYIMTCRLDGAKPLSERMLKYC